LRLPNTSNVITEDPLYSPKLGDLLVHVVYYFWKKIFGEGENFSDKLKFRQGAINAPPPATTPLPSYHWETGPPQNVKMCE